MFEEIKVLLKISDHVKSDRVSPFMLLPVEIRMMIYRFVVLCQPCRGEIRSFQYSKSKGLSRSERILSYDCNGILRLYQRKFPVTLLPCICTANRQIFHEIDELLHSNPIRLTIVDDFLYNPLVDHAARAQIILKNPWIQKNATQICLQLTIEKKTFFFYPTKGRIKSSNFWNAIFFSSSNQIRAQPREALRSIEAFLSGFPNLEQVYFMLEADAWDKIINDESWEILWNLDSIPARISMLCTIEDKIAYSW
jgi:hypothetical protein